MKDDPEGDQIISALESIELGDDEDGDPITSCVVVPAEAVHASAKTLPKPEFTLLALQEAPGDPTFKAADPDPTPLR